MEFDIPETLSIHRDKGNQLEMNMVPRNTIMRRPIASDTVSAAGGSLVFSLNKKRGLYNFRDSTLAFNVNYNLSSGATTGWDFSKTIKSILVESNGTPIFHLQDAWAIEQLMQPLRGTEEGDTYMTYAGDVTVDGNVQTDVDVDMTATEKRILKGNARLYRKNNTLETSGTYKKLIEIPLSRFGEFFMNNKYYNMGTTDITFEISNLNNAVNSDAAFSLEFISLTQARFQLVEYSLDSSTLAIFEQQLAAVPDAYNTTYAVVRPYGFSNSLANIDAAIATSSLDMIGGFIKDSYIMKRADITEISDFVLTVNEKTFKQDSINSTRDLIHMTLEGANMVSDVYSGMSDEYMDNYTRDATPYLNMFLIRTCFEAEEGMKGGLSTIGRNTISGTLSATSVGEMLYIVYFCTGTLLTFPDRHMFKN
jgi:hypothetical protein